MALSGGERRHDLGVLITTRAVLGRDGVVFRRSSMWVLRSGGAVRGRPRSGGVGGATFTPATAACMGSPNAAAAICCAIF